MCKDNILVMPQWQSVCPNCQVHSHRQPGTQCPNCERSILEPVPPTYTGRLSGQPEHINPNRR